MTFRYTFASLIFVVLVVGALVAGMPTYTHAYYYDGLGVNFCHDAFCADFGVYGGEPHVGFNFGYPYDPFVEEVVWVEEPFIDPWYGGSYDPFGGVVWIEEPFVEFHDAHYDPFWGNQFAYNDPLFAYGPSTILDDYPYPLHSFVTIERDPWADMHFYSPDMFYNDWDLAWYSGAW